MSPPYMPPNSKLSAFNCGNCGAFANQVWFEIGLLQTSTFSDVLPAAWALAMCAHCQQPSFWYMGKMIYPAVTAAPLPNADLPDDVLVDYKEARAIFERSPRGAAALLRLCVEKLCKHLGERGKDINADIAALVKRGLLPAVQQALDGVRVVGNNMVHPGQLDPKDVPETVAALFGLVNLIADQLITAPKQAAAIYGLLPTGAMAQIQKRDGSGG